MIIAVTIFIRTCSKPADNCHACCATFTYYFFHHLRYFDRYRDKKDLAEEVMKMKLDMITPFKPYSPKYKYPIVHLRLPNRKAKDYDHGEAYVPSWLLHRQELMHRRMEQFHILPKDKKD